MRYLVRGKSEQYFSETGMMGAALFIVGTVIGTIASWFYYIGTIENALARSSFDRHDITWIGIVAGVCGLAAIWGFLLVLVGRRLHHEIIVESVSD